MPLSATWINKKKAEDNEQSISLERGSSCYLVIAKKPYKSKRFIGLTSIGSESGKKYKVSLGVWGKDFTSPNEVLKKWDEMKTWGKENNCDLRNYGKRLNLQTEEKTLKEVIELYLQWKSGHVKQSTHTTVKNRLNQILLYLPDGILVDEFSGGKGRRFILEKVCARSIANDSPYQAHRHRRELNQVFNWALDEGLLEEDQVPSRLGDPYPFEKNIKSNPHPHLTWDEFRKDFIPTLNANPCNASRLTDLTTKAVLLMLTRVSAVVSMQWDWYDDKTNCWIIPSETEGIKRSFGDTKNDHYIPHTLQLNALMNNLRAINGDQKYVFFSPHKGNHPYVSSQTPNDHLINLNFQGRQDAHGFRHVATNALVDIGGYESEMVSRCLGHLHNDGAIGHYDFAKRLDKRKEIHGCWNQLLITEGLRL